MQAFLMDMVVEVFMDISIAVLVVMGIAACLYWVPADDFSGGNPVLGIAVLIYHLIVALICSGFRSLFRKVSEVQQSLAHQAH